MLYKYDKYILIKSTGLCRLSNLRRSAQERFGTTRELTEQRHRYGLVCSTTK